MQKFLVRSLFLPLLLGVAESWALPACLGNYDKSAWTNCEGTHIYPNKGKYKGEWRDGYRFGRGTFTHGSFEQGNRLKYVG